MRRLLTCGTAQSRCVQRLYCTLAGTQCVGPPHCFVLHLCPITQEMERRIARAGGHRSDDEARALNARIAKLSEILEGVNAEHAMLLEQVCRNTLDMSFFKQPLACHCCGGANSFAVAVQHSSSAMVCSASEQHASHKDVMSTIEPTATARNRWAADCFAVCMCVCR